MLPLWELPKMRASINQRFHLLAIKWELSKRDLERLRAVVKWSVERSASSYEDYLASLEWSSDLPAVLIWMELRREEAETQCLET